VYELFILGELLNQPMHGYLLRDIVNLAIGPARKMSWGALYPLIRRLEEDGWIEQATEFSSEGARPRKVYRITPEGRERFYFLMLRPEEYDADYPDRFNVKLMNFDQITAPQQREILENYRGYLQFLLDQLTNSKRFVAAEPHIDPSELTWILRNLEHRLHVIAADREWVQAEIARLAPAPSTSTEVSA
jgi:DNA-binding PadR family transcriptional regulator